MTTGKPATPAAPEGIYTEIWTDPEKERFFQIPVDFELTPGPFELVHPSGQSIEVDEDHAAALEVTRDTAVRRSEQNIQIVDAYGAELKRKLFANKIGQFLSKFGGD